MCISPSLPPINPFIYLQTTNPYLIHIHALYEGYLGLTFLLSPPKNLDRAAADITQLLRRFENILAFESVRLFFFGILIGREQRTERLMRMVWRRAYRKMGQGGSSSRTGTRRRWGRIRWRWRRRLWYESPRLPSALPVRSSSTSPLPGYYYTAASQKPGPDLTIYVCVVDRSERRRIYCP